MKIVKGRKRLLRLRVRAMLRMAERMLEQKMGNYLIYGYATLSTDDLPAQNSKRNAT